MRERMNTGLFVLFDRSVGLRCLPKSTNEPCAARHRKATCRRPRRFFLWLMASRVDRDLFFQNCRTRVKGRPYKTLDELSKVRGIGAKLLRKLRAELRL
jgi:hypothetical protein